MNDIEKLERLTKRERLGELLLRFSYLNIDELLTIITEHQNSLVPLGEFLLEKNIINHLDLRKLLDFQKNQDLVIDKCLGSMGLMTNDKKWEILTRIDKVGEILIRNGVLKLKDLYSAIEIQEKTSPEKLLGDILFENFFLTKNDLRDALETQKQQAVKIMSIVDEITKVTQLPIKSKIKHINLMGVF